MSAKAVFADKDGTLIENVPYNVDPAKIVLAPGALEALRELQRTGYEIVVVSNQSGVARGFFEESALEGVELQLRELLAAGGVELAAFYYCPHFPNAARAEYAVECACRKPAPGLLERAAHEHRIDLHESWLIGDILDDVEAGRRAGCRTVLLDNGNETEGRRSSLREPDVVAKDLLEAAQSITAGVAV